MGLSSKTCVLDPCLTQAAEEPRPGQPGYDPARAAAAAAVVQQQQQHQQHQTVVLALPPVLGAALTAASLETPAALPLLSDPANHDTGVALLLRPKSTKDKSGRCVGILPLIGMNSAVEWQRADTGRCHYQAHPVHIAKSPDTHLFIALSATMREFIGQHVFLLHAV